MAFNDTSEWQDTHSLKAEVTDSNTQKTAEENVTSKMKFQA